MPKTIIDPKDIVSVDFIDPSQIESVNGQPTTSNIADKIPNVLSPNFLGIAVSRGLASVTGVPSDSPGIQELPTIGSAIREAPDVIQGGLAVAGGVAAGPAGAVAGGALGSVIQNTLRKLSPAIFGDPTSLQKVMENVTGANVSTSSLGVPDFQSNVIDDIILDTAASVVPGSGAALKSAVGRKAGRTFGKAAMVRPVDPKIDAALKNLIDEVGIENTPSPRIGASDKIVGLFEKLMSPRGVENFNLTEAAKVKQVLPRLAGVPVLDDAMVEVTPGVATAFNKSKFRKKDVIPITAGESTAQRKRAIDFTIQADRRFTHMRNGANNLWGKLRETLKNDTFTLSPDSLDVLADMKTQVDIQYFSGTPEVRASLSKLKNDLDSLIPGAEKKSGLFTTTTKKTKILENITTPKGSTSKVGTKESISTPTSVKTEIEEATARQGDLIKQRQRTDITQVTKALSYDDNLALLSAANGKYNFDQIRDITTKLAGDIPAGANISFANRNRIDIVNKLKSDIQEQILTRPDGPAVSKLYNNAVDLTRTRYEIFNKDVQGALSKEASILWDRVFKNEDYARAFIRATGDTEQMRTEVVSRLFERATDSVGQLDPKVLKSIWDKNDGLRAAFSVKQRNNLDQYFEVLRHINTSELSEIGMTAMGFRLGNMALAIPSTILLGTGNPMVAGTTAVALVSMNKFTKNVLLGGGEFPRAALRLAKLPPGAASAKDIKTVLTALHGTKIAIMNRDKNGNVTVVDPEFKLNTRKNRRTNN